MTESSWTPTEVDLTEEYLHFVTGRLAERSLRSIVGPLAERLGFAYSVDVLPITVAALLTPGWIARHWQVEPHATRVILPGYCHGDLAPLAATAAIPIHRGPRDLRELPAFFGRPGRSIDYGAYDIEIVAEINHAPRLSLAQILREASNLLAAGADLIDIGCDPDGPWSGVADCVRAVRDLGCRVSIDSLDPREIQPAVEAGAELVLSVNSSNRHAAGDWGCEVVVIPDQPQEIDSLEDTADFLARGGVPIRLDPILEPIGCGFMASLERYAQTRRRFPDAELLMGIGNLTEMTDCDSAGVNVLLLGICQELGIRSVLTTQVINWARSSVAECRLARALVHFAWTHGMPPKHLEAGLVMLRDAKLVQHEEPMLAQLAQDVRDANYRLFAQPEGLHLIGSGNHFQDEDPFRLFQQLLDSHPKNVDASHAFYLGFELAKAHLARQLGKQYEQDEALDWGMLTVEEDHHRLARRSRSRDQESS